MKIWVKILVIGIITLALLFACAYVVLVFQGKQLIVKQLEGLTGKKVTLGYFDLILPLNIEIKNLNIEELAKVESISISPSLLGVLTGNLAFNKIKIISPEFSYEKALPPAAQPSTRADTAPGVSRTAARQASGAVTTTTAGPLSGPKRPLRLVVKQIKIRNGRLNFIDRTIGPDGIKIIVKDIDFDLSNLYLAPRSAITNFEIKGKIPWLQDQEEGKIEAEGWLNLFKKDMEATVKIENIDGIYLYPYYSNWVDLEKTRIQKAKLNFSSNIHGLNNNVTAECHLELMDIDFKPRPAEEEQNKAEKITAMVLDIFKTLNQGKIVLDFTVRTKMDQPQFGFSSVRNAFEEKLTQARKSNGLSTQQVLGLPANFVKGTFKGLTDLTTAVVSGTISAGKEVTKTVQEAFRREKKE